MPQLNVSVQRRDSKPETVDEMMIRKNWENHPSAEEELRRKIDRNFGIERKTLAELFWDGPDNS